ncbi:type II toxin-antitoxin system RelE/ParE family toxin [Flavobacteriaceae bacterium TP-CH-4]|uniref:Type II toxin-antitoxin system RelE/ParE family toxin n=1 Tax=Pelagihabitans pacificus TaxID=2696054 RepID=A0A967AVX9_9FLAO|nr:type II toxin-antitoxin system RelE/ParE family toxin [Pelagihabitans pacificus]
MAYQINVSKDAEKDILIAKCHYRISGLEQTFDSDFTSQISYLRANPFLFQIYYRNVRRAHFNNFKYSIHFIVQNKVVYILRVLHHRQRFK